MMNIKICENDDNEITQYIADEIPVIIIKNFEKEDVCNIIRKAGHVFTKENNHQLGDDILETFWRMDVLPSNVETNRIFRTIFQIYSNENKMDIVQSLFKKMITFQRKYLDVDKFISEKIKVRPQLIHYPIGGGFFDWHEHTRFPTNYGLILNLSRRGKHFQHGSTEFKMDDGSIINVEESTNIGYLIMFRYDLIHRVTPCDPDSDLTFSNMGRWSAIVPIY